RTGGELLGNRHVEGAPPRVGRLTHSAHKSEVRTEKRGAFASCPGVEPRIELSQNRKPRSGEAGRVNFRACAMGLADRDGEHPGKAGEAPVKPCQDCMLVGRRGRASTLSG